MEHKRLGIVVAIAVLAAGGLWYTGEVFSFKNAFFSQTYPDYTPGEYELRDTTWVWFETQMSDGAVISPNRKKVQAFTLTFGKDGKLSGTTDCNSFFGTYSADQGALTLGPLGMTEMYCEDSQEQEFVKIVADSPQFMFSDEDTLVLLIKYDSGSVFLKRAR
jgi:heat shock protein HslJ